MKRMMVLLILTGLGLVLITACSSGGGSSSPDLMEENQSTETQNCQDLIDDMKTQNGRPEMSILESLAEAANKNGMTVDQASLCLDQNLQLTCSSGSCLIQERNSL